MADQRSTHSKSTHILLSACICNTWRFVPLAPIVNGYGQAHILPAYSLSKGRPAAVTLHDPPCDSLSLIEEPAHGVYCVTLHFLLKSNPVELDTLVVVVSVIDCQILDISKSLPGQFFDAKSECVLIMRGLSPSCLALS